ncbi:S41 family peptidase [Mucilaginibacter antarcticus]|uniref:S41 family peptidase n=1 Tax=Mucilaginibacter antarcticus TaxID=1855725 RepID=UPI0036380E38
MKYILSALLLMFAVSQTQAQYVDEISKKLHDPKELRKDIDFARRKLEKEHINIYKFISKKALDHKFDSLKKAITSPMISLKFNARLMTVLSTIGDGHLSSTFEYSKFSPSDMDYLQRPKKQSGLKTLDYILVNNRLYVKQNNGDDTSIKTGDEILSIENKPVAAIIDTIMRTLASDGYNTTFKKVMINNNDFSQYYGFIWGAKDTMPIELKSNNLIRKVKLMPQEKSNVELRINNTKPVTYKFLRPDSSIAFLKVRTFMLDTSFKGFDDIFKTFKKSNSKILVLDLRGNTGGALVGLQAFLVI